jgi:hypothetical protein
MCSIIWVDLRWAGVAHGCELECAERVLGQRSFSQHETRGVSAMLQWSCDPGVALNQKYNGMDSNCLCTRVYGNSP